MLKYLTTFFAEKIRANNIQFANLAGNSSIFSKPRVAFFDTKKYMREAFEE